MRCLICFGQLIAGVFILGRSSRPPVGDLCVFEGRFAIFVLISVVKGRCASTLVVEKLLCESDYYARSCIVV